MSDQYYGNEDDVETPGTQLANIQAHQAAVAAVGVWAEETLNNIRGQSEVLWNAAAERNDVETQNGIAQIYQAAEHMKQNLVYTNTAMASVLETAQALSKQKDEIEGELKSLVSAIDNVDYNNPVISSLIEQVEQDAYEMVGEGMYDDAYTAAMESASEDIYDNIYRTVKQLLPNATYNAIATMLNALEGNWEMNDIQRGLLMSLARTFEAQNEAQAS